MRTRNRYAGIDDSATGYYLRQAEAALGIERPKQNGCARDVRRIELSSCTLYIVPFRRWACRRQAQARWAEPDSTV
jgi:hypothetical protein